MPIMNSFINAWYQKSPLLYSLVPFSLIYQAIVRSKRWLYVSGYKKQQRFSAPIIIVGNLTVGGTGKTPLLIELVHFFSKNGYRPGVVTRGYGGKPKTLPLLVTPDTCPEASGDEALLIAQKTRCPVMVSPKRVLGVEKLISDHHCNIILSDDGLQHYALHRDIEIAVVDGARRFGNEFCLPAGPLREPKNRLKDVDFIVTQGNPEPGEWGMQLRPEPIYALLNPHQKLDLARAQQKPIHAIAGIGNPSRFFNQLTAMGFTVLPHAFPDHYVYQYEDIRFEDNLTVIMTEKDAVKCELFADHRHWCLPVKAQYDEQLNGLLLNKLKV